MSRTEEGRPRVHRGNDRLGSRGVLNGFSWVLMSTHGISVGFHGFSWVLSGYSDCAFLGSQVVLRQAPPPLHPMGDHTADAASSPPGGLSRVLPS